MKRRDLLGAATAMGVLKWPVLAEAQGASAYPTQPIRLVVGFPAGQASDTVARLIAAKLGPLLGGSAFVDNKPGAAGIISHQAVKAAKPDGHTLLIGSTATLAVNPVLYRKLPYDPIQDFAPITQLSASPMFLVASPGTGVNTLKELVAYVKAHPGATSYASAGSGTSSHIVMEMFKKRMGLDIQHVPYKGSADALKGIMSGEIAFGFDIVSAVGPQVRSGKLRALGTSTLVRNAHWPDVPTLVEQGVADFVYSPWSAMLAPAGTRAPIVDALCAAVNQILKDKDMLAYNDINGSIGRGGTPDELRRYIVEETRRWAEAVRISGAQVE